MGRTLLDEWLKAQRMQQRELAELAGCSEGSISSLLSGRRNAGRGLALALERATDGAVPVASWQPADPAPEAKKPRRHRRAA
jgi:transcriptional regulator with XRE-family HTH domain